MPKSPLAAAGGSSDDESARDSATEGSASGAETGPAEASDWPLQAKVGLPLGPALALLVGGLLWLLAPEGLGPPAQRLLAMTFWMAVWWMTEAVPLGITSLLPLAAFPPLDILTTAQAAGNYSTSIIWLFFGGFQLAFALERTGLHRRLALGVMRCMGTRPPCLMLGIMLATAFLSMFLSNTSTTLMLLPIVEAIVSSFEDSSEALKPFGKALLLGLAYSASTGGLGTIIGTPPNGVLASQAETFDVTITFARWLAFAAPLSLIMVLLIWIMLIFRFRVPRADLPAGHPAREAVRERLGPMSQAEVRVAIVFSLTVLAWMVRKPVCQALGLSKARLGDDTISVAMAILLFMIPAKDASGESKWLMDWPTLLKTPWHILLLFGGGFALATGFKATGLSLWLGQQLSVLQGAPTLLVVFAAVLLVTFLTEVTSNTATANVLLPILGDLACSLQLAPVTLMVPATLAASCAFMLPVATPPNAIVCATRRITIRDMASTGLIINFASAVLITTWMFLWGHVWFDMSSTEEKLERAC